MKTMRYVAALAVLIALAVGSAQAQEEERASKFNIRLGLYRPSDGTTKSITGQNWSVVGLTYDWKRDESDRPVLQAEFSVVEANGSDAQVLRLGFSKLWWQKSSGESGLYYGGGVGLHKIRAGGERENRVGGQIFVGYSIKDAYYLELRDTLLSSITVGNPPFTANINLSGFEISVGTRRLF